jgi:hypothetical protein
MTEIYDSKTAQQVLIPMIRKVMPGLIAHQITGVQPMGNAPRVVSYTDNWFFRVHNKKYWPYQFTPYNSTSIGKMERWCWDNISHGRYWRNYGNKFAFKRKEDAALFVLRWS